MNLTGPITNPPEAVVQAAPPPASTRWTDERVTLEKLRARDEDAWDIVLIKLGRIAKEYLANVFSGGAHVVAIEDAEDMTSILVTEIYKTIDTFNSLDHLEAHFRKALRFDALDLKEKLQALRRGGGNVHSMGDPEATVDKNRLKDVDQFTNAAVEDDGTKIDGEKVSEITPADLADQNDLRNIIFNCAATLDLDDRVMLHFVYIGKTHAEIAVEKNVSTASIGSRLQRIYQKMRPKIIAVMGVKGLKDYGITIN